MRIDIEELHYVCVEALLSRPREQLPRYVSWEMHEYARDLPFPVLDTQLISRLYALGYTRMKVVSNKLSDGVYGGAYSGGKAPGDVVDAVSLTSEWLAVPSVLQRGLGNPRASKTATSPGDWWDYHMVLNTSDVSQPPPAAQSGSSVGTEPAATKKAQLTNSTATATASVPTASSGGTLGVFQQVAVRIISLPEQREGAENVRAQAKAIGFSDVDVTAAVDLRNQTSHELLLAGVIAPGAYVSMSTGRKRYHEVGGAGAVGCMLSHLDACSAERPTLVLEADAQFSRRPTANLDSKLAEALAVPQLHTLQFGPSGLYFTEMGEAQQFQLGKAYAGGWLQPLGKRIALGTHAVLYSPEGCRKVRELLNHGKHIDMQYDDLIGVYSRANALNAYIEAPTAFDSQTYEKFGVFREKFPTISVETTGGIGGFTGKSFVGNDEDCTLCHHRARVPASYDGFNSLWRDP